MSRRDEILNRLYGLQRLGIRPGLKRMKRLLNALGDPQNSYRSIHIAGTNGKGSTSAILHSILSQKYRTGLYTSPHLERFNERIRVNGDLIKDSEIVSTAERVEAASRKAGITGLTFFEFTTAMAFLHFRDRSVEAAVLETGMGGRWDATNIVKPAVSVITSIGLDHTEFLGSNIEAIASEKAGIIKKGVPVVTAASGRKALKVLRDAASKKNAPLLRLGADFTVEPSRAGRFDYSGPHRVLKGLSVNLCGAHQYRNAGCALAALELLSGRFDVTRPMIRRGLKEVFWPGRVEVLGKRPLVILDSAHNPEGALALKDALSGFRYGRLILVLGVMADKDIDGIMKALLPKAFTVILTRPDTPRAASASDLFDRVRARGVKAAVASSVKEALKKALETARPNDAVCVTGSIFTVGEARSILKRA